MANRFFEGAAHAAAYAKFRPQPPATLITRVVSYLREDWSGHLEAAADVGCGSGQSTEVLIPYFEKVTGLDISEAQINEAIKKVTGKGVSFKVSESEKLPFPSSSLQLVTSCQAAHWFDISAFYKEADRILVPGGVLALYGYLLPRPVHGVLSEKLNGLIDHVYSKETEGYWGTGRNDVDNAYSDEKFIIPYKSFIRDDTHFVEKEISVAELTGDITTSSGFQNFRAKNGNEAAQKILDDFQNGFMALLDVSTAPENTKISMRYQFFLLMGRKPVS